MTGRDIEVKVATIGAREEFAWGLARTRIVAYSSGEVGMRPIQYIDLPIDQWRSLLVEQVGLPDFW